MNDRDSLMELFEIVTYEAEHRNLPLTLSALPFIQDHFGLGCDVYYRRRLSVCRMLIDLHLPVENDMLDVLLAAALSHSLPGDHIPFDHTDTLTWLFGRDQRVAEVLATLRYGGEGYFDNLVQNRWALLIRLTERGVLVESLYEWSAADAKRYLRETRDHFFPMCIYAKEHYRELAGPVTLLMEKTRSLVMANEALLKRYDEMEQAMTVEILAMREENAALRAMIAEIEEDRR